VPANYPNSGRAENGAQAASTLFRYIYLFRSKISKAVLLSTFAPIVRLLQANDNVVHSYAAITIERLLALHLPSGPLLVPADVSQHLEHLLTLLFQALAKEDSTENEYLMKCVMRVIVFVRAQIMPIAGHCLDWCASAGRCPPIHARAPVLAV
jgi:exportin-2 (importin alpha re-exporter)